MTTSNGYSVAQQLEIQMKKKHLVVGGVAAAAMLVGAWAFAQSTGHGPGAFGPPFMHGRGPGGMGPGGMMGMHGPMGPGMHGPMGPGMQGQFGPGGMHGGPVFAFDPARLDAFKAELAINPAQEEAWTKYTKAIQDAATAMKAAREGVNPEAVGKLGPQERFAFATKMREQAQKQHETIVTAANELLATLDETQKAKAQQSLPGLAFGPGRMHGAFMAGPPFRR
jgi:hypothetical protein